MLYIMSAALLVRNVLINSAANTQRAWIVHLKNDDEAKL